MKFVIKYFPEIVIKSKSVRILFSKKLESNLRNTCKRFGIPVKVHRDWDKMEVSLAPEHEAEFAARTIQLLKDTPGIEQFHIVNQFPLTSFEDVAENVVAFWSQKLSHKSFVVRVKRKGKHEFNSLDLERALGGALLASNSTCRVDLHHPDVTVRLEVEKDQVFLITETHEGLNGYPLGVQEPVLSLMSGGYDSTVASFKTMQRGCYTHFVFFNLGGAAHEVGVKQVALYLWSRFGAAAAVKFVTVNFEGVVDQILRNIDESLMGVVLKRMMVRAASKVADELRIPALVTGEAIAQVSSQTITNLAMIEDASSKIILRPLLTNSKPEIIRMAREIGTEEFARNMPEYCGVISQRPTTAARKKDVESTEANFDFTVLDEAVANAEYLSITDIIGNVNQMAPAPVVHQVQPGQVVIDIRKGGEIRGLPPGCENADVKAIPFYELNGMFKQLDQNKVYLLYCAKGVMSQLHALYLREQGYENVLVYRPAR